MLQLNKFSTDKLMEQLKDTCSKEALYWTQRRSTLVAAADDDELVKSTERDEMVAYLLEICDREDMSLSVETYSLAVSLLDRFLSNYKVKSKYLECLAIACLYIACKVKEEDENVSVTADFLLDCDCKCSISELLRMEQMILTKFEWSVNDTTAIDFLYIYYALLVNQYNSFSAVSTAFKQQQQESASSGNANAWAASTRAVAAAASVVSNAYSCLSPPPCDLDFMHELEYKLKQCLCVSKLTANFKPHMIAYSLLSVQMERSIESIPSRSMRFMLEKTMDTIRQMCKVQGDVLERCTERIRYHLLSIENTKVLFDRYFKESSVTYRMMRDYKPSSLFIPQLSAIATQLDAIKEEDEEEAETFQQQQQQQPGVASNTFYGREEKKEAASVSGMYDMKDVADSMCMMTVVNGAEVVDHELLSYADILMGRRDHKRKLSENSISSDDGELDYDTRMM